ncbi:phage holin family protein [Niabella ginsenosidivorans]|nr:phage holin family protein [Niabella ginsenosidivorans]
MNHFIQYRPNAPLLVWLLVVFILDFIFGLSKAIFSKLPRTSNNLRKSITKFLQYGGCIIVSMVILNIVSASNETFGRSFAWFFGDVMLYIMIYTEVVSVFENMEAMAPGSTFVKVFVRPVRKVITFQLKQLFREDRAAPDGTGGTDNEISSSCSARDQCRN